MRRMRIVHIIDYFQPKLGYQEYYLAKYQRKSGYEVAIVTSDRYFPFNNYDQLYKKILGPRQVRAGKFVEKGITVYRLPVLFEIKTLICLRKLYNTLKMLNPDLVLMHNMFGITPLLVALAKRNLNYRLIYDTHVAEFNSDFSSTLSRKLYYSLYVKILLAFFIKREADKIVAIRETEKAFVCQAFDLKENEVEVVSLGVDTGIFYPDRKVRHNLRKEREIPADETIIIYTGKVQPEKEVDLLIELIRQLKRKKIKVKLLILGNAEKELERRLKALIAKLELKADISWMDGVPHAELAKYYQVADLAIWPGNPTLAYYEALATGLPIIIPETESETDLYRADVAIPFQRGNLADLVAKTTALISNKSRYGKISQNARKLIEKEYSWEKIAEEIIKLN